jgi:PAS domain S-box-containing protein
LLDSQRRSEHPDKRRPASAKDGEGLRPSFADGKTAQYRTMDEGESSRHGDCPPVGSGWFSRLLEQDDEQPQSWVPSLSFLKYIAWAILVAAACILLTMLLVIPDQPRRASGPAAIVLLATTALWLLNGGRVRAALTALVWGLWLAVTILSPFFGGVRALLIIAYPVLILMGGWLLGTRTAVLLTALTVAALMAFVAAELSTLLPPQPPTPSMLYGLVQLTCVVVAMLLIIFLTRSYRQRIDDVRRLGSDLAQRSADLQASEAELERAQAVARVGSWVLDLASGRLRMSAETCRIFALPEGTTGSIETVTALLHPDDRQTWQQASAMALAGEAFAVELRIDVDGSERWIAQHAEVAFDDSGKPLRSVGTTQDITERKELEASLREQREFFRLISESIGEHIAVLDLEGRRLYNSPSYRQFFGGSRDLLGSDSFADIHPDDRQRVIEAFTQTAQTGLGQELQYRLVRSDGSVRHMASAGKVIIDESGQVSRVIVVSHDVTDRKQAEQWERIAATAFESQQGMFITDAKGVILRVNQAFSEITGYSSDDCVARTPKLLSSGRHNASFYAAMRETLERSGNWQGEIWNRRKNGEIYPEWLTISAVRDSDGKVTNYVSTLTDITMRKAAQEEIQASRLLRRPHRPAQPASCCTTACARPWSASARRDRQGASAVHRPRQLQDPQRHPRTRHGRPPAAAGRQAAVGLRTRARYRRPPRRRRVRRDARGSWPGGSRKPPARVAAIGEKILAALNRPYDAGRPRVPQHAKRRHHPVWGWLTTASTN